MKILKVVLIILGSVIGIVGATILGLYLTGGLNPANIAPEDIYFAYATVNENNEEVLSRFESDYYVDGSFSAILSSSTESATQKDINLSFDTKSVITKKLSLVTDEEELTSNDVLYFANNKNGQKITFKVDNQSNQYITDGNIIIPKTVRLNSYFDAFVILADDGFNIGGVSKIFAQSENLQLSKISKNIRVDVPVNNFEISILQNTTNKENAGSELNLNSYYFASVSFIPARSEYLYGSELLKKVIFTITNDENHISLVDEEGINAGEISFVGRFLTDLQGSGKVSAHVFKNAEMYTSHSDLNANELYSLMNNENSITKDFEFTVKNLTVDGFNIDNDFTNNGVSVDINEVLTLTINDSAVGFPIGLQIVGGGNSSTLVQNEIKNIYLSIVYDSDLKDATNEYFKVLNSEYIQINGLKYYKINFNQNKYDSSYWRVSALNGELENAALLFSYISNDKVYGGEGEESFGPHAAPILVLPENEAEAGWSDQRDLKTTAELVGNETNSEIMLTSDKVYIPISFDISNLATIKNIGDNPAYTLAKFFVYSENDLTGIVKNIAPYNGEIDGISGYVYELTNNQILEIISLKDNADIKFNLIFAIIRHDALGNPTLKNNQYQIVSMPEDASGNLVSIPFEISKVANILNTELKIKNPVLEQKALQKTEDNLELTITLENSSDLGIFKKQVELGNIYLKAQALTDVETWEDVDYIYYKGTNGKVELKNALGYVDFSSNKLTITLSTDTISFDGKTEKNVRLVLVYEVLDSSSEFKTDSICVFSGKISELTLGDFVLGGQYDIDVTKTVGSTTYTYNGETINLFNDSGFLDIKVTGYGIDDTYDVKSSNNSVIQIINTENGFMLNALKSGIATVTINPNYPADPDKVITLNFTVESDINISGEIPTSYDQFVGKEGEILNFSTLTNGKLKVNNNTEEINDFVYSYTLLNNDITKYIEFTYTKANETDEEATILTGIKVIKNFEMPAVLVVYYTNMDYGIAGAISVEIKQYYTLSLTIDEQSGAKKPENSNAIPVFAETEIELKDVAVLANGIKDDKTQALNLNGVTLSDIISSNDLTVDGSAVGTIYKNGEMFTITFNPVKEMTVYTLTFTLADSGSDDYAFNHKVYVCVNPNIKLDDAFENALSKDGDVYLLNTPDTAFKNGNAISWPTAGNVANTHYIKFSRIFTTSNALNLNEFSYASEYLDNDAKITNITKLTEVSLTITYGGKEFKFAFWAEPNISTDSLSKVNYNGKKYISLYAGQTNLTNVLLGDLIKSNAIISQNALYTKFASAKTIVLNNVFDGQSIEATLNNLDIIETKIIITSGDSYIIRDALIFPKEWSYITYASSEETDVYKILSGAVVASVNSGDNVYDFASILDGKDLNTGFNYKVFVKQNGVYEETNADLISVSVGDKAQINTKYAGKNAEYKLHFTVFYAGLESTQTYAFDYYVDIIATQSIDIYYPFRDKNSTDQNTLVHNIYYSEFENNQYVLDFSGKAWNLQNAQYVKLNNGNEDEALIFEIKSLKSNGQTIANVSDFAVLDGSKLIIKNNSNETLDIVVGISTDSGSSAEYNIHVSLQEKTLELKTEEDDNTQTWVYSNDKLGETTNGQKTINLSGVKLYEINGASESVSSETLKWAVVNTESHELQTSDNSKIYVDYTTDPTKITLVALASPNTETGILVAYTESGIVKTFEITIESVYKVTYTQDVIYAGQNVDLKDFVFINTKALDSAATVEVHLKENDNYSLITNIGSYPLKPSSNDYNLTLKYKIYDGKYSGTSEDYAIEVEHQFTISANISLNTDNSTKEVTAYQTADNTVDLSKLFTNKVSNGGNANYTYKYVIESDTLSDDEKGLFDNKSINDLISQSSNTITISPKAVEATRTVTVKVTMTATSTEGTPAFADVKFTSTLTITIKPDCEVEVNYPTFGTNQTYDRYYVYVKDVENVGVGNLSEYISITPNKSYTLSTSSDLIAIDSSNNIKLRDKGKAIGSTQTIPIEIRVDNIMRHQFTLVLCKDAVFTARLEESSAKYIYDQSDKNIFGINDDGDLTVSTKAGREDAHFEITIVATHKVTGETERVTLYGKGDKDAHSTTDTLILYTTCTGVDTPNYSNQLSDFKLSTIFSNQITSGDSLLNYTFHIADYSDYDDIIEAAVLTEPSVSIAINFYYNNNLMPITTAAELFKIKTNNDLLSTQFEALNSNIGYSYDVKVVNASSNVELATFTYQYVLDYTFDDAYASIKNDDISGGTYSDPTTKETYNKDEFYNLYGLDSNGPVKVLKTIELTAGNDYDLIEDVLIPAGLKNNAKNDFVGLKDIYLTYGQYTDNAGYQNNLSAIIPVQSSTYTIDGKQYTTYTISPKGAQEGGNIVHLVVRMGYNTLNNNSYTDDDTYIIRIKIVPSITISAKNNGAIIKYEANTNQGLTLISANTSATLYGTDSVKNIPLSDLVTFTGIKASDLIVSVSEGARYVVGTGTNRLGYWDDNGNTVYGIQLRKTILGGNRIVLTVSDKYGYSVEITLIYNNLEGASPEIAKVPNSIFEGESFLLAFQVEENGYNVYEYNSDDDNFVIWQEQENVPYANIQNIANIIILNNFIKKDEDEESSLSALLNSSNNGILNSDNLSITSGKDNNITVTKLATTYYNSSVFKGAKTMAPDFKLTLKVSNPALGSGVYETLVLDIDTALNQRYTIQAKDKYANYGPLYLGLGNTYNFADLFEVYDNSSGVVVDASRVTLTGLFKDDEQVFEVVDNSNPLSFTTKVNNVSFNNKLSDVYSGEVFKFNLSITDTNNTPIVDNKEHDITKSVYLTPKYYGIKYPSGYLNAYGQVLKGDGTSNQDKACDEWASEITFVDYYGDEINTTTLNSALSDKSTVVKAEKIQGAGTLVKNNYNLTGLSPDSPVTINVTSNGETIGQVLVTLARYYALTGSVVWTEGIGKLTDLSILDANRWIWGIKAKEVGGTNQQQLPRNISLFTYESDTPGYEVIYSGAEYQIQKNSGTFVDGDSIEIKVKYLGLDIGKILIEINSDTDLSVNISNEE